MSDIHGESRLYVNEGLGLGDRPVLQFSADAGTRHYPLYDALGSVIGLMGGDRCLSHSALLLPLGRRIGRCTSQSRHNVLTAGTANWGSTAMHNHSGGV